MRKRPRQKLPLGTENFLAVLEGIEGGFAIFTGIVVGLSFQAISRELLIMTALIGIIVSAFNSSAVRYASEHYVDELDGREKRRRFHYYFLPSLTEFVAYTLVSLIVVVPLLVFENLTQAIATCIALTLIILYSAGYYRGTLLRSRPSRDGAELALLGLLIIVVGGLSGWSLSRLVA